MAVVYSLRVLALARRSVSNFMELHSVCACREHVGAAWSMQKGCHGPCGLPCQKTHAPSAATSRNGRCVGCRAKPLR